MPGVKVLDFAATPEEVFTRWDIVGHQVNRHLVSAALNGTPGIVADLITFPPGFVHRMHRHPYADLFMLPLSGSVRFFGVPGPEVDVHPGQLLVVPRNNWHEVRNLGDEDCTVFHFFTGAGVVSVADIGFEPYRQGPLGAPEPDQPQNIEEGLACE
jgi:quercetin dioxygenase-like cupin family protein